MSNALLDACVRPFRDDAARQCLGTLDEDRVVEQRERLQRRVRRLALCQARLARRAVERAEQRERRRPLAEGVQAAAITVEAATGAPLNGTVTRSRL